MVDVFKTIHQRLATIQDCQKKYADRQMRPLEFSVGDLKVAPMKMVLRFGKKGKLSLCILVLLKSWNGLAK